MNGQRNQQAELRMPVHCEVEAITGHPESPVYLLWIDYSDGSMDMLDPPLGTGVDDEVLDADGCRHQYWPRLAQAVSAARSVAGTGTPVYLSRWHHTGLRRIA